LPKDSVTTGFAPPKTLYHYTTGKPLVEIVQTGRIWASELRFLNDGEEFRYALRIFERLLREEALPNPPGERTAADIENNIRRVQRGFEGTSLFVAALSANGDELSQWRAYGRPGPGFALGIDTSALAEALREQSVSLVRCEYDRKVQEDIARTAIFRALSYPLGTMLDLRDGWTPRDYRMGPLMKAILETAPRFKHPSFHVEQEWRLVLGPSSFEPRRPKLYRSGRACLVPYVEISLSQQGGIAPFSSLVVGPTPERELALSSATRFMADHSRWKRRGRNCVRLSETPYRDWI
jgi:hypothetical protein